MLPDEEFQDLSANADVDLGQLIKSWEKSYQNLFGIQEMTYNIHVFTHAEVIRKKGPWPELSAFTFEDQYNKFKKWVADGTFNQPKQVRMRGQACQAWP